MPYDSVECGVSVYMCILAVVQCVSVSADLLGDHVRPDSVGDAEGSVQVRVEHAVPVFSSHLAEGLVTQVTSVIDEDVDFSELLDGVLDHQLAVLHRVRVQHDPALLQRCDLLSQLLDCI